MKRNEHIKLSLEECMYLRRELIKMYANATTFVNLNYCEEEKEIVNQKNNDVFERVKELLWDLHERTIEEEWSENNDKKQ